MTTDTALGVTKRCVEDGFLLALDDTTQQEQEWGDAQKTQRKLDWVNHPELHFGHGESVRLNLFFPLFANMDSPADIGFVVRTGGDAVPVHTA